MDYNKWIGLSGWGLSLILGFLKIRESYFDRFRIHILSSFNSFAKCNTITIASKKTITIVYYELFFATNKLNVKSQEHIETGIEEDGCNIKIPFDSSYDLKFEEQYYFDFGN